MDAVFKKNGHLELIPESDRDGYRLKELESERKRSNEEKRTWAQLAIAKAIERDWHSTQYEAQALTAIKSGMQAENEARSLSGSSPAYGEDSFKELAGKLRNVAKRMDELAVQIHSMVVTIYPEMEDIIEKTFEKTPMNTHNRSQRRGK